MALKETATPTGIWIVELAARSMYKRIAMNSARNTRHRFCLALVVSMLFCGLSSIEIPEITRLVDDTSNDFTLVDVNQTPSSAVAYQSSRSVVRTAEQIRVLDATEHPAPDPVLIVTSHDPAGYLELLCINRT
jgi:hypothetical protein